MSIFIPGAKAGGGSGEEVLLTPVEQPTHGFDSTDIGRPVYFDGSNWVLAQADDQSTVQIAVIQEIRDVDNLVVQQGGRIEGVDPTIIEGGGPLVPGNYYRLSEISAGIITDDVVPTEVINAPVYLAIDTDVALILPYRADMSASDGGGGATSLNDLTDVNVPAPADGQVLTYNESGSPAEWIAADSIEEAPTDTVYYSRLNSSWAPTPISPVGGITMSYKFNTDNDATDPGDGDLKLNNDDHVAATEVYVSNITENDNDVGFVWDSMNVYDYIGIWEDSGDKESIYFRIESIVNHGTWHTIGVSVIPSPNAVGGMDNNRDISVFIINNPANKLPPGGEVGQFLKKISGADFDTEWGDSGDLGTIQDWGDIEVPLGSIGGGTSNVNLNDGHLITATLTADQTINFTSDAGHANTSWELILHSGGFTPTFQFGGVSVTLPTEYDVSVDGTYWIAFRKLGSDVYLSERMMA